MGPQLVHWCRTTNPWCPALLLLWVALICILRSMLSCSMNTAVIQTHCKWPPFWKPNWRSSEGSFEVVPSVVILVLVCWSRHCWVARQKECETVGLEWNRKIVEAIACHVIYRMPRVAYHVSIPTDAIAAISCLMHRSSVVSTFDAICISALFLTSHSSSLSILDLSIDI